MGWTQNFWKNSEKSWQMTMLAAAVKKRSRSDKSLKGRRRENNKTDYCPWPAAPASHRTEGVKADRQSVKTDRQSVNRPTEIGAIGRDRLTPGESRQTGAARLIRRGVRTLRKASMAPLKRRASCKK